MIRTLYVGQQVQIVTGPTGVGGVRATGVLPVSSASCEVTKPVEAVTAFGRLGSLALAQTNLTTCKSSIKAYLSSGASAYTSSGLNTGVTAGLLRAITGDAVNGTYTVITVTPNGFTMSGILTSLGVDMALGGFGMIDFGFAGIGQPLFSSAGSNATTEPSPNQTPASIVPVTTVAVGGQVTGFGCANSYKFSLDMPTDNLACLGDPPDMPQMPGLNSLIATKPPYKATVTVEGFGIDVANTGLLATPANLSAAFTLGGLNISLPNAIVSSKSFNNAVGTANASYNFTMEDVTATFA